MGDMVAEFVRLAAWKRSRGLTAKVVTVSDIVDGRYGDYRTGSRDLPEVIRRFLKDKYESWGVAWVLLGGDVSVIPPRLAAGGREGHMEVGTDDPPPDNKSFWNGSFLEMHVVTPGTWWPGSWQPILVNPGTGQADPVRCHRRNRHSRPRLVLHDGRHVHDARHHGHAVRARQRPGRGDERDPAVAVRVEP